MYAVHYLSNSDNIYILNIIKYTNSPKHITVKMARVNNCLEPCSGIHYGDTLKNSPSITELEDSLPHS
jgi:hypothetical protein